MLNRQKITADFCVIGGGMAGICAAIAAARQGATVVLMHERPVLGGNASSEIRMWIRGAEGKNNMETGIIEEITLENYYRNPTKNYYIWDTVLYDFVIREENITLLLNCTCMDATCEDGAFGDGRTRKITSITGYQMTTQTFFDVQSTNYADCSGDSILAPLTGAEYRLGRESADEFMEDTPVKKSDNSVMGMSCLIQGRETGHPVPYIPPNGVPLLLMNISNIICLILTIRMKIFGILSLAATEIPYMTPSILPKTSYRLPPAHGITSKTPAPAMRKIGIWIFLDSCPANVNHAAW